MGSPNITLAAGVLFAWSVYTLSYRGEYGSALMSAMVSCTILVLWWRTRHGRGERR